MPLSQEVTIYEVGPRDGLQNESENFKTQDKLALIKLLADAGLQYVEATSFVSPKWVPQMADHEAVVDSLDLKGDTRYPVLVPNEEGMQQALKLGVKNIAVFTAASETFSQKKHELLN